MNSAPLSPADLLSCALFFEERGQERRRQRGDRLWHLLSLELRSYRARKEELGEAERHQVVEAARAVLRSGGQIRTREAALKLLSGWGEPEASPALTEMVLLVRPEVEPTLRIGALYALQSVPSRTEEVLDLLLHTYLTHADTPRRSQTTRGSASEDQETAHVALLAILRLVERRDAALQQATLTRIAAAGRPRQIWEAAKLAESPPVYQNPLLSERILEAVLSGQVLPNEPFLYLSPHQVSRVVERAHQASGLQAPCNLDYALERFSARKDATLSRSALLCLLAAPSATLRLLGLRLLGRGALAPPEA